MTSHRIVPSLGTPSLTLRAFFVALVCVLTLFTATGRAEESGQRALDEATQAKLTAESVNDLSGVIRLCHQALEAGLDKANREFAKNLLAGTLLQRAEILCSEIFDRPIPASHWPQLRQHALADLEEAIELSPEDPDAHFLVARLQSLPGGEKDKAVKAIGSAVNLTSKEPALQARALALRASLVGSQDERRSDLNEAAKLAPHNVEVLRARGMFLLQQNELEPALQDFEAAIAVDPELADAVEGRGLALFMMKKYDEAMESFDKVVTLAPNSPVVYTHRARVEAIREHYKEALAELNKALRLDPDFPVALLLRARIYQQMGENGRALADVNGVLRRDPDNSQAIQLHALLLAGGGKLSEAIDDLQRLLEKEPSDTTLLLQLGIFYVASQKNEKAIEAFSAAIEHDPKSWIAYRSRGDCYLNVSKQADAIADYEAALQLDSENSGILNNLAWVLATSPDDKLRDGKRAIELATAACKLTEFKQAHILSTLAAGYAESGDFVTAIEWSEKAVNTGDDRVKDQLRKELTSYHEGKPWREAVPPPPSETALEDGDPANEPAASEASSDAAKGRTRTRQR